MSLLTLVQSATRRLGINTPSGVVLSSDNAALQLLELANEEGRDLGARTAWSALEVQTTFTTVATESQGDINTIAPNLKWIINNTIWNQTLRRPVYGPLSPQMWRQQKAQFLQGPWNQFRIIGTDLNFIPIPVAGQTCAFEYITKAFATDSTGTIERTSFANDADLCKLDEEIMTLGLIWRWRQVKGLDFEADYLKYDKKVMDAIARDGTKPTLSMNGGTNNLEPVVVIPAGSWGT